MNNNKKMKSIKISERVGELLDKFSKGSYRTITGSAEYLIIMGLQMLSEKENINEFSNNNIIGGNNERL